MKIPARFARAAAFLLAATAVGLADPRPGAIITVGLRYDDYSASSPAGLERAILDACARRRIPVTFGVVPELGAGDNRDPAPAGNLPLDGPRRAMLIEARGRGILEVALHGYAHRAAREGLRSEFAGVPAAKQAEMLARGKAELEAFAGTVSTFIPPWNSYDGNTLEALARAGFTALSASPAGAVPAAPGLRLAPATCLVPDIRMAVEAARRAGGGIVIPYFHPYEFKERDAKRGFITLPDFEAALDWLAAQPDVQTLTLGAIARLPAGEPAVYAPFSRWARLTPPFLEKAFRSAFRVYPRPGFPVPGGALWLALSVLAWYGAIAAAGWLPASLVRGFLPARFGSRSASVSAAVPGMILVAAGLALAITGGLRSSFATATAGAAAFGLGLAFWRAGARSR